MSVVAITMVKDEADVVAETAGHMRTQVDAVMALDNDSSDGTREILESLGVTVIPDPDPAYYQAQKMTGLAARAAAEGAEWVVPFDADEWWYSPFGRIADVLRERPEAVATATVFDHVATGLDPEGPPVARIGWRRRTALPLGKVACRPSLPAAIAQGNHGASYSTAQIKGQLVVRHFPYRSVEQLVRKVRNGAAAYAATDLPEDTGAHWREWGHLLDAEGPEALADIFRRWYWSADPPSDPGLIFDPCR